MRATLARPSLLTASWVLPIAGPPVRGGAVLLAPDGRILAVGPRERVLAAAPARTRPVFAGEILMPALVNAHVHLELTALAGKLPSGQGLVPWVRALLAARPSLDAGTVRAGMARALAELHAAGVGALGDVTSGIAGAEIPRDAPFAGVRFHEALAARPGDAEAALAKALDRTREPGPLEAALAAHSPATCSAQLLAAIARASAGKPVSVHLAEDPSERTLFATGAGAWAELLSERDIPLPQEKGSPTAIVAAAGLLGKGTLAVHAIDLDAPDLALLAASGATAVLCPRSNRFLGVGAADAARLEAAGIPLALGTDSLGSTPSLSILEEAAALGVDPARAVRAATLGGARALGLALMGSLEPGKRPGLIAVDAVVGRRSPESALVEQPRATVRWLSPATSRAPEDRP
jgi:cytosine/adenosine deaminase-related metal-dependent hydrolase